MTIFYLFLFKCVHKLFENGHIELNKYSKISEENLAYFLLIKIGNVGFKVVPVLFFIQSIGGWLC